MSDPEEKIPAIESAPVSRKGHSNLGWRKPVDMAFVAELASLGMPKNQIAESVGVDINTLNKRLMEEHSEFSNPYQIGLTQHRIKVLQSLNDGMKKSFIPAIFLAKQPHILGFQDVQRKEIGGEVRLVIEQRVLHEGKISQTDKDKAEDVG